MQKYEKRVDTAKTQYNLERRRDFQMVVCEQFVFLYMQIVFCIKLKFKLVIGI